LLIEKEGMIYLYSAGWAPPLMPGALQDLTAEDLRDALRLRPRDRVLLSSVRPLPDISFLSEEFLEWTQRWWIQTVTERKRKAPLARVS
jgi:hypothetical protein